MNDKKLEVCYRVSVDNVNIDMQTFDLIEETHGKFIKSMYDAREKAIRDGLIKLGWTPPKETCS